MRIIRFLDVDGWEGYGIPGAAGKAERVEGSIFDKLVPTGEFVPVARLLAPVVPCNIFCIGLNYADHAAETGAKISDYPVIFMKPTSTINHPEASIPIPACCTHGPEVDFEAELAVIIGKRAKNVAESEALTYVSGYTAANDISARRWQKHGGGGQWVRGKSFDGFCPIGPVIVTADEIPNPQNLRVRSLLNGAIMQDGHTSSMIFTVASLISLISQDTTLMPGTIILTGTPPGVGFARTPPVFLKPGDSIVIEIEDIGQLKNSVVDADFEKT